MGKEIMRKKILGIIISMLLTATILPMTAFAGDPENPEIKDELNDTDLLFLDIESAWFYENADEPEFLYTALKVHSLSLKINAVYSIRWTYNGKEYVAGFDTYTFRENVFRSGE